MSITTSLSNGQQKGTYIIILHLKSRSALAVVTRAIQYPISAELINTITVYPQRSLNISGRGRPSSSHSSSRPSFKTSYKSGSMLPFLQNLTSDSFLAFDFKMLLKNIAQVLLPAASLVNAQFSIGTYTSLVGGLDTNSSLLGNYYN
jgi:hypothetical protein